MQRKADSRSRIPLRGVDPAAKACSSDRNNDHGTGGKNRGFFRLVLLVLPLWYCTPALAQDDQGPARSLLPQNNLIEQQEDSGERTRISRREASDIARERFPGRVLSIRLDNRHWRVRMDQEGTVFNVLVDADSGSASRAQD